MISARRMLSFPLWWHNRCLRTSFRLRSSGCSKLKPSRYNLREDAHQVTRFIQENTSVLNPPLVPEIRLHLATESNPLWSASLEELEELGIPEPYWCFAWSGGQAVSRYVLDHWETILRDCCSWQRKQLYSTLPTASRAAINILDFGSGSGLVGLSVMKAAAGRPLHVTFSDIDPVALKAIELNLEENKLNKSQITLTRENLIGYSRLQVNDKLQHNGESNNDWDIVFVGDVCYDEEISHRAKAWMTKLAATGTTVIVGDPKRGYFPGQCAVKELAKYSVVPSRGLEDNTIMATSVFQVLSP